MRWSNSEKNGDGEDRIRDLTQVRSLYSNAKRALYQLSYVPDGGRHLRCNLDLYLDKIGSILLQKFPPMATKIDAGELGYIQDAQESVDSGNYASTIVAWKAERILYG